MSDSQDIMLLCPGQGAQHAGMGKDWHDAEAAAADVFKQANDILGFDLTKLCFEGPEDELSRTDVAQAALYTASIASLKGLEAQGKLGNVVATAGLSLGEFTALHIAGAFDFETGLKLVRLRGQAMQDAAEASDGGMVALIGAEEDQAYRLCEEVLTQSESDQVLVPANFNCPGQIVLSGSTGACEVALQQAEKAELRATPLKVAGAFHSPLMQPAADRLAEALEQATWQTPTVPVVSNVTARPHDNNDIESIKKLLVDQLTSPVRWGESMAWAIDNINAQFVELAPNKVLSGLMRRIDRKTKVQNVARPEA